MATVTDLRSVLILARNDFAARDEIEGSHDKAWNDRHRQLLDLIGRPGGALVSLGVHNT